MSNITFENNIMPVYNQKQNLSLTISCLFLRLLNINLNKIEFNLIVWSDMNSKSFLNNCFIGYPHFIKYKKGFLFFNTCFEFRWFIFSQKNEFRFKFIDEMLCRYIDLFKKINYIHDILFIQSPWNTLNKFFHIQKYIKNNFLY